MDAPELRQGVSAGRSRTARGHEPAEFRAAVQTRDRRQSSDLSAETARCCCQTNARKQPPHHAGGQRCGRLPGHRVFPLAVSKAHWSFAERVPGAVRRLLNPGLRLALAACSGDLPLPRPCVEDWQARTRDVTFATFRCEAPFPFSNLRFWRRPRLLWMQDM